MLSRIEIGTAAGQFLAAPLPLAGDSDGRQQQEQQQRRQQRRWYGAHAWRAMTLTPGEVEIYSSFMNNAPPETRRRLFAASNRLSASGDAANGDGRAHGHQRLQKYVTQQNQRHFLAADQPRPSTPPPPLHASTPSSRFAATAQASRPLTRRSLSWSGLSADSQFRATRAIRKMLFSARRRAAGCGGCVIPADSLDLVAGGRSPAPIVAVLRSHRGGDGGGGHPMPPTPSSTVSPSRRLGDVSALTGRQAPVAVNRFRHRLAAGGLTGRAAGSSHLPAASAELRSIGARDRNEAAVAAVAAATAAESRRAAAGPVGRTDSRFHPKRLQAPAAAAAVTETLYSIAAAAAERGGGASNSSTSAVCVGRDEPSPPSNTPDDLSSDIDNMSLLSGGGAGDFAIEAACLTSSSGTRRIEVYMPALAT